MALAAAGAGLAAAGAYLDGRYHIRKDLTTLWYIRRTEQAVQKAIAQERLSPYYTLEDQVNSVPPQHEALWSREGCYTYREFWDRVNSYAQWYLSLGLKPGDVISFYLTNRPEFMMCLYATWAIGCYASMINHHLTGEAILHCLRLADSKLLLVDEDAECRDRVNEVLEQAQQTGNQVVFFNKDKRAEVAAFDPERPDDSYRKTAVAGSYACLIFTSGTTGFPKACPFEMARMYRSNVGRSGVVYQQPYGIDSRWYDCMPLYHGTGIVSALGTLTIGGTVCIAKKFSLSKFLDDVHDSRATGFIYVGEVARYLLTLPETPRDRSHRMKIVFGNGLRPDVWRQFRDRFGIDTIAEFFSSSEGVMNTVIRARGDFFATCVGHQGGLLRLMTRNMYRAALTDPNNNKELMRDDNGRCVRTPLETGGEILVAVPGKGLDSGFAGYLKNDEATQARFAENVFEQGDLYYRSNDALRRDEEGRWFFLDRLGDTFRWKSENISTAEVAVAVGEFPGVQEANVYGVLVPSHDGRAGCAALYIKGGSENYKSFDWAGLTRHARLKLPKYAVPLFIRVLEGEIHGTHNHKQNKVPLREEGVNLDKISSSDKMLWLPPDGDSYVEFTKRDWDRLDLKQARL